MGEIMELMEMERGLDEDNARWEGRKAELGRNGKDEFDVKSQECLGSKKGIRTWSSSFDLLILTGD